MAGTGLVVESDFSGNLVLGAPADNGIEEAIATRWCQLIIRPAQARQVLAIVLEVQIGLHVPCAGRPRSVPSPSQRDGEFGCEHPVVAENATRLAGVFHRDKVWMGAGRSLTGE